MNQQPQPPAQERGPMDELTQWFASIPPVTRALFVGTLGVSIVSGAGLLPPVYLIMRWPLVYKNFQLWRLITAFFWYPLQFPLLTLLYFMYRHSWSLEQEKFAGKRADYVLFIIFSMVFIDVIAVILNLPVLLEALVLSILYVWSMENKTQTVSFFFGLQFQAMYLPWVYIIFDFLTGTSPMMKFVGIAVGHLYYFLDKVYPENNNGQKILFAPQFLVDLVEPENRAGGPGGAGNRLGGTPGGFSFSAPRRNPSGPSGSGPQAQNQNEGLRNRMGYSWGRGNRLAD
ncbi:Derlin 1 [Blyttiomyces sp. JEL0837]|nr:Derlin 1 [Blyttiomyces sp. JEL0837]